VGGADQRDTRARTPISRRAVLAGAIGGLGTLVVRDLLAPPAGAVGVQVGSLLAVDANGWRLPPGFVSRVVAVSGQVVGDTGHVWHLDPDGAATFPRADGGWVYVSNSERRDGAGGVGMVRFDASGAIVDARTLLSGTTMNCSGGATPWGTWLSCEEHPLGRVFEVDPSGARAPVERPAMGRFQHEAAVADEDRRVFYLTEDRPDAGLYRFEPSVWGDLSAGRLDVLCRAPAGLYWAKVPDPSGSPVHPHHQLTATERFNGAEGVAYRDGRVYFTTKGDGRVWRLNVETMGLDVLYEPAGRVDPQLFGVDQMTVAPWGDVVVVEDGDNMQIVMLSLTGEERLLGQLVGVSGSELTGLAFDPSGRRLYVSSQRNPGVIYEISGPFPPALRRYEESDAALAFSAGWFRWAHPSQSAGEAMVSTVAGSTMRATVVGDVVRWIGQRGPERAVAEVSIDGTPRARVDTYAPSYDSRAVLFEAVDLGAGPHRLEIRHAGANAAARSTPALVVDAVEAAGVVRADAHRYEEWASGIRFSGSWASWSHPSQSGGSALVGTGIGSVLGADVVGPVFRWIGQMGPARAVAEVFIDGTSRGRVDTWAATYLSQVVLFETAGLGPGRHVVEIRLVGANLAAGPSPALVVDAVEADGINPSPSRRFQEWSARLEYRGAWFHWADASQSAGGAQVGRGIGASVGLRFGGPVVRWIGQRGPARATAEVLVDGTVRATVDCYAPRYASQEVLAELADLGPGDHQLEIRLVGANPAAEGGPALVIDAIEADLPLH